MNEQNVKLRLGRQMPNLFISTLAISILSLALPIMTLQVYDRILPNPGSGTLPVLVAAVCVALILETGLRLARSYLLTWNGSLYEHQTSCRALDRMLWADMAHLGGGSDSRNSAGEYLNRLSGIARMRDFENGYLQVTLFEALMIPLFLALVVYIGGWLVLIPLSVMALFGIYAFYIGSQLRAAMQARDDSDDRRYDFLLETLEGVHTIKSFNLEDVFCRRYEFLEKISTGANYAVTREAAAGFNASATFSQMMIVGVISAGAILVLNGAMTAGALIAVILLSGRIMQPVQRLLGLWVRYQDYQLCKSRLEEITSLPQVVINNKTHDIEPQGALELRNVAFRYKDRAGDFLFENVNLSLRPGDCVRITGAYGSGRSTLLSLMAGIYEPVLGEILVDDRPPSSYPHGHLGRHIGLLQTEGKVFRGTIRDNITLFGLIPEAQAQDATKMMGLDGDIAKLPLGFDTVLDGLDTHQISPGLQQRIAMARVLAARPRILLFDNADRNLDRNGYRAVYRALNMLKETTAMVIVSDDVNFVRLANRHYKLRPGGLERLGGQQSGEINQAQSAPHTGAPMETGA